MSFGPGLFRLSLAAAVFLSHVSRFDYGRPAVMIFFMLSGYWVARMQDGPHRLPYVEYLGSRMTRIWPQLAVAAIITAASYAALAMPQRGSMPSTLALFGLASRHNDAVGTIWSLDIEAQFYVFLPAALAASQFLPRLWQFVISMALAFSLGLLLFFEAGANTFLMYAPMFGIGIAIYQYKLKAPRWMAILSISCGLTLLTGIIWPPLHFANNPQWLRDLVFMGAASTFAPFVAWNVWQPSKRTDRLFGNLSYPFYLVHEPVVNIAQASIGTMWKPAALVASCAATGLLYVLVDRPIEMARTAFFKSKRLTLRQS